VFLLYLEDFPDVVVSVFVIGKQAKPAPIDLLACRAGQVPDYKAKYKKKVSFCQCFAQKSARGGGFVQILTTGNQL